MVRKAGRDRCIDFTWHGYTGPIQYDEEEYESEGGSDDAGDDDSVGEEEWKPDVSKLAVERKRHGTHI